MTTTSSTTNAAAGSAILTALGANSGIDTSSLVTGLVSAAYDSKTAAVTTQQTTNTAKISSLATINNGIDSFASALTTLISGGTLFTQPSSSNSGIVTATTKAGAQIGSLSAQLSVRQIAQAQSLVSGYFGSSTTAVGTGALTIATPGGTPATVTIDSSNNTLAGVARAINAAGAGVTASVITDSNGARLALKGATGASNAFTVTPSANADAGLAALSFGTTGLTASGTAVISGNYADPAATPVGQGNFTLTTSSGTQTLTIDSSNDSLNGMAAAITGAGLGLTATVVTDSSGSRLSITDGSGGAPSFTLAPASGAQAGTAAFAYPATTSTSGMTRAQTAQDAIVRLDGVDVSRSSNTIGDLVDGITLSLVSASPTETVSLTATRPTAAIKQAVSDFVSAYNELKGSLDTATAATTTAADGSTTTGPLYGNSAIRTMMQQLSKLTSTALTTAGAGPQTLAEIGVSTNRDGTLALDDSALSSALANYPDSVEAMFNPTQHASSPLISITSAMGTAKPGTYVLSNIVAQTSSTSLSGTIAGVAGITTGSSLFAASASKASGLVIQASGDVASATITVDPGLGGLLQSIRDTLRASGGVLDTLSTSLTTEKTSLADQLTTLTDQQSNYKDQLTSQFSTMSTRLSTIKATQSYLTQQIAVWTKSSN